MSRITCPGDYLLSHKCKTFLSTALFTDFTRVVSGHWGCGKEGGANIEGCGEKGGKVTEYLPSL